MMNNEYFVKKHAILNRDTQPAEKLLAWFVSALSWYVAFPRKPRSMTESS
jgi:hypothetical protein